MTMTMIFLLGLYTAVGAVLSYAFFGVIVPNQTKYYFKIIMPEAKADKKSPLEKILDPPSGLNINEKVREAKKNLNKFERGHV